jgi:hypothetical protein
VTAAERGIRAWARAAILAARQKLDRKRTALRGTLAHEIAKLRTLRFRVEQARERLAEAFKDRAEFLERVPKARKRFLNSPAARAIKVVPWALCGADTMIIARAWGLYGPVAIPFVHPSVGMTALTSLLRAGLVSFGLIFGVRFAGGRIREAVDELRVSRPKVGSVVDVVVASSVLLAAFGLIYSTAHLQAALIQIVTGGTSVSVSWWLLLAISGFLAAVSLVCGYFLNEPELKEAHLHKKTVEKARKALDTAVSEENTQRGVVRSIREQLRGLDRQEQLLIDEQEAHADAEVYVLKKQNGLLYGFELADEPRGESGA